MNTMTEWRSINLGKLEKDNCLLMRNGFPCGSNNQHEIGVPQLRPMNIDNFGEIDLSSIKFVETDKNIKIYLIKENDIIFNNTNSKDLVGKTVIWNKESNIYVLSNHMTLLRFDSNCGVDPEFIAKYFYLLWINNYFQRVRRQHVNQASISLERLRDLEIPLPPLPEQRAIALALRAVQGAREARLREAALERERKAALMEHLFTHGTRGEATKMMEIGEMPESWRVVKFEKVIASSAYGPRFSSDFYDPDGNVATLRTTDLDNEGQINYSTMPLAKLDLESFEHHFLKSSDFLITRSGTCGIAAIFESFEKPVLPGAFLIRFRLSDEINPQFLKYYVNSAKGRNRILQLAGGAVQKNLSGTSLRGFQIPLPILAEQDAIVRCLIVCDSKIAALSHEARLLQELFRVMLEELMSGNLSIEGAV